MYGIWLFIDGFWTLRPWPVAVRSNHQFARGVDKDSLTEDSLGSIAAIVVGPPLVTITPAGYTYVGLSLGGGGHPALGQYILAVNLPPAQQEKTETGKVTG